MARSDLPCICGLGQPYADCCGRFHRGEASAPTVELLMRSRFTAFAMQDEAYLLATWHPRSRPRRIQFDPDQQWTSLDILGISGGHLLDTTGTVEFRAHYRRRGRTDFLHEHSQFGRDGGRWVYVAALPHLGTSTDR